MGTDLKTTELEQSVTYGWEPKFRIRGKKRDLLLLLHAARWPCPCPAHPPPPPKLPADELHPPPPGNKDPFRK